MRFYVKVINKTYEEVIAAFDNVQLDGFMASLRDGYTNQAMYFEHGIWTTERVGSDKELKQAVMFMSWLNEIVPGGEAAILAAR